MGTLVCVSLKLPYKKVPDGKGGFGYYAVVPVNIALPTTNAPRSKRFEGIIDSGASRCVFHAQIGRAIGLDIKKGEVETTYLRSCEADTTSSLRQFRAGAAYEIGRPSRGVDGLPK